MSGHSTPSARSLSHTGYGGSPFDASGVSSNPESSLDMTGTSPGGRQYFDQPIFEYHTVPELREEDNGSHANHHHHQSQQQPQQAQQPHPERRLSGQIPVVAGALRGMRVRTGCRSGSISKNAPKNANASGNANRRSLDLSAGFTIDVKSEPNLSSIASINPDLDVSGMLSLANVAAGHHEGISPTSNPVSPNGIANRRHRNQPTVLPLSSTTTFLAQTATDGSSQLKVPGSAMVSPTGAAVAQFQGLAL
ncbi:hypothetical protein ABW19_dt0208249 [Dactylella cylindrospora]|nr:hypothetical protein ABW19_dt0208249 [Dactylella cylindrospora]